jgi:hypothetical protein
MSALIDKIVPSVLAGNYPQIAASEREVINEYVYEQWRRVPELYDRMISDDQFKEMHRETVDEFEQRFRPVTAQERSKFGSPGYLKAERHRARVLSLSKPSTLALEIIASKGLYFSRTALNRSFLIGSVPVMKLTPPHDSDLRSPEVEVWLAIGPNVAIVLAGHHPNGGMLSLSAEVVRSINRTIAKQSEIFAGRDKALVASIARYFGARPPA